MRGACKRCGLDLPCRLRWQVFGDGRRHIRAECSVCGHYHHFAAQTPENVSAADQNPPFNQPAEAQQPSLFGDD